MQSSDCRTNIMKYQIETCWKILEITIKSKMNQMKNVSPNIRKKHCAGGRCRNIWSEAIFRVHTFLFMAPQTELPSFISYCCLHKNTISGLHMIEASVQAARSKRNNFSNNTGTWNILNNRQKLQSFLPAVDSCVLLLICALSLIKLKYFPTFFVS